MRNLINYASMRTIESHKRYKIPAVLLTEFTEKAFCHLNL